MRIDRAFAGRAAASPADSILPVLVLDEGCRGDLGLVRSLGMARIPVHLATPHSDGTTAASRFVTRVHAFPHPDSPAGTKIEALRRIALQIGGRPPVMVAGDGTLALVSDHRAELADVVRHDLPDRSVLETCFQKDRFGVEAERLGFPTPLTRSARSIADVRHLAPTLTYPVFIKPFTKDVWGRLPEGTVESQKGQRVDTPTDLLSLFERLARYEADHALIQAFVPSPDSEHYSVHTYIDAGSGFCGAFTTRKIRVWPPHRGVGCLVKSQKVPELVDLSRRILEGLSYSGFALLQYKRDLVTGEFSLLEINCRFSTSGELTARCGANFPALSYAALTGTTVPPVSQREGPCWLDLERDFSAFADYRRFGEWNWPSYLRSLTAVRYPAFLARDDLRPFARRITQRIRARIGRIRGKQTGTIEFHPPAGAHDEEAPGDSTKRSS